MTRRDPTINDTVVYYVWDAADWLLYVGCTGDLPGRMRTHSRTARWRHYYDRVSWSAPMAAQRAFEFEADEIYRLAPIFNIRDNKAIRTADDAWWDGLWAERQDGMEYPTLGEHVKDYERRVPKPLHHLDPDALAAWLDSLDRSAAA